MSAVAWFTEGPVSHPRPSDRRRALTPTEKLCIDGWAIVPLYDPIQPERVVKALLSMAGTVDALLAEEAYIERVCRFYLHGGDDPRPADRRGPGEW